MNSRAPHAAEPPLAREAEPARAANGRGLVIIDRGGIHGLALCDMLTNAGVACRLGRTEQDAVASWALVAVIGTIEDQIPALRLYAGPAPPIVAVLRHPDAAAYARAIDAGADGVVGYDCGPGDLINAVRAAAAKQVLMPIDVARELARSRAGPPVVLTAPELRRLQAMSRGATLAGIAAEEGR